MPHSQAKRSSKDRINREWRERLTIGSAGQRSFFDGLYELKLPSIGRPVTRADIDAAIDEEIDARHGPPHDFRRSALS